MHAVDILSSSISGLPNHISQRSLNPDNTVITEYFQGAVQQLQQILTCAPRTTITFGKTYTTVYAQQLLHEVLNHTPLGESYICNYAQQEQATCHQQ